MKILIITNYNFTSKLSGAINRVLGLAKALSNYASIKILHQGPEMVSENLHFISYTPIFSFNPSVWISDAIRLYTSNLTPSFFRVTKEVIGDADIVQLEQPYLLIPTLMLTKALGKNPLIVLDEHNVDFLSVKTKIGGTLTSSLLSIATLPYIFISEKLAVKNADFILCVSQVDQELFTKLYGIPRNKLIIVPNGVEFDRFEKALPINVPVLENNNKTIFFHGTLSWYPNLEAANMIVEYLAPKIPEAIFLIAGANMPLSLIRKIEKTKNVKYLGYVENLEGWIKASYACIAPVLRGGGTKLKVLEYAAAGKPIIATYKAIEGLEMTAKVHGLFYKNCDDEFVKGIKLLLRDNSLAKELGINAQRLAKKYDWYTIGKRLYDFYNSILDRK
jgi:glycosyltransferase involved in cell wall biosynthesis